MTRLQWLALPRALRRAVGQCTGDWIVVPGTRGYVPQGLARSIPFALLCAFAYRPPYSIGDLEYVLIASPIVYIVLKALYLVTKSEEHSFVVGRDEILYAGTRLRPTALHRIRPEQLQVRKDDRATFRWWRLSDKPHRDRVHYLYLIRVGEDTFRISSSDAKRLGRLGWVGFAPAYDASSLEELDGLPEGWLS